MIDWKLLVNIMMSSILFASPSCKKIDEDGFRIYTIKCGKHKSRSAIKFTRSNTLSFQVIFMILINYMD